MLCQPRTVLLLTNRVKYIDDFYNLHSAVNKNGYEFVARVLPLTLPVPATVEVTGVANPDFCDIARVESSHLFFYLKLSSPPHVALLDP